MKASDLRTKSDEDLKKELLELAREAFNLRMQKATGQSPKPNQFTSVRRDVARVKTVISERRVGREA